MARCFVSRRLPGSALDRLAAEHEVEVWGERLPPGEAELAEQVAEADGLLSLLTDRVDARLLSSAARLRAMSALGRAGVPLLTLTRSGRAIAATCSSASCQGWDASVAQRCRERTF